MIIQQIQATLNTFTQNSLNSFNTQTKRSKSRYNNLLDSIYSLKQDFGTSTLLHVFEEIDKTFRLSDERKANYHIQAYNSRTILTVLGEVRFTRTVYKHKVTGKCYTHLDTVLGLDKYKYLDPKLEAALLAKMAKYSMAESARQINAIVSKSFNRPVNFVSRQLARSILLRTDFNFEYQQVETPDVITIMLDEKYVKLQQPSSDGTKSIMVKSAVIYEDIVRVHKNRTRLKNKRVFIDIDSFNNKLYDFITKTYNLDKIKRINIIGDGASWIKSVGKEFKSEDYETHQYLDLFHFRKALHHVVKNGDIKSICESYIKYSSKRNVKELLLALNVNTEIGIRSSEYILNNYSRIKATLNEKIKCSMEGHISHNLASMYASRPKGYSKRSLIKLVKLREAYINGVDIARELMKQYSKNINYTNIDYSDFDKYYQDTYKLPQGLKMIH